MNTLKLNSYIYFEIFIGFELLKKLNKMYIRPSNQLVIEHETQYRTLNIVKW